MDKIDHIDVEGIKNMYCMCNTNEKMALRVPEQKNGDHFLMATSPQNGD